MHRDSDDGRVWRCDTHEQRWQGVGRNVVFYQCALHGHAHLPPRKCALAKAVAEGGFMLVKPGCVTWIGSIWNVVGQICSPFNQHQFFRLFFGAKAMTHAWADRSRILLMTRTRQRLKNYGYEASCWATPGVRMSLGSQTVTNPKSWRTLDGWLVNCSVSCGLVILMQGFAVNFLG